MLQHGQETIFIYIYVLAVLQDYCWSMVWHMKSQRKHQKQSSDATFLGRNSADLYVQIQPLILLYS